VAKSPESENKEVEEAIEIDAEVTEGEETLTDDVDAEDDEPHDKDNNDIVEEAALDVTEDVDVSEDAIEPAQVDLSAEQKQSGGFVPLLFGGLAAGGIGFAIATFLQPEDNSAALAAMLETQVGEIEQLQARINNIPAPDFSGIETQVSDGFGAVAEQISALEARLDRVERQPNADGTLSETALEAYQAELDELQSTVLAAASQAEEDLATARAEAERLEQEALAAAEAAAARAAINRIATAVDSGNSFSDALSDLDASDVPDALVAAAETGVMTNAQLVEDFPAVARAALATARSEGASDDASGIGGFFRNQFDVRSTSPQEGPGPDAVFWPNLMRFLKWRVPKSPIGLPRRRNVLTFWMPSRSCLKPINKRKRSLICSGPL